MANHLLSRADILGAISRTNGGAPQDGTYRIVPSWIGSERVWMAERISEVDGYEIAYADVAPGTFWYPLDAARFGYWCDPATNEIYLDQTIHTRGNFAIALEIGAHYSQLAIWDWADQRVWECDTLEVAE
jgi:hypothetical protein